MVKKNSISASIFEGIRKDFHDFTTIINHRLSPERGLFTYHVNRPDESKMRLHLRIEPDGAGVLFIDVTDVIHLNSTAAEITKMALDGIDEKMARVLLSQKYRWENEHQVDEDLSKIYQMVDHLCNHTGDCFTCALKGLLETAPMFSVQVNAPYKIDIALTYGCNNQCPHCYNEIDRFHMPSLPLIDWYKVLDKVAELGIPHIILTGGEATLHPNLSEIIKYADQLGMIVGMNSNGRHVAHEPYMLELAKSGLNHIQITLGSCYPQVHNLVMGVDSFSQTVRGIENALNSGIHVITNTTLMQLNVDHAEEIVDFLFDKGIRTFAMNGMIYSGGGFSHPNAIPTNELAPLLVRIRDHAKSLGMRFLWYTPTEYCRFSPVELEVGAKRCNAGEYSICIEPNGDVLPCQSYYVSTGNILNDPWEEIWNNDLMISFRNREDDPQLCGLPEICWECPDLSLCGGGCRIELEAQDGIRVAESAGGGCVGCSGYVRLQMEGEREKLIHRSDNDNHNHLGGYVPHASQRKANRRSSGILQSDK
ncbi:MAG: radical SAM protein [Anaerolineales bacterium]|jgi:radical SAM protein with 4Fe4S-binding SPASM domain